jgi:ribosomal protein S12 methylthiotransferase accessory factor
VQSRLTYIAGSRDDLRRRDYGDPRNAALYDLALDLWEGQRAARVFGDIPSAIHATVARDVTHILAKLRCVGLGQAIVIDLSRPRFDIPVVRVIVPGLEADHDHGRLGRRGRAFAKSLQ